MRQKFNQIIERIKISPIVSISELAKEKATEFRARTGKDLVLFQRGEMSYPTPDYIKAAAKKALDEEKTKYPKSGGEAVLKKAILEKLEDYNNATKLSSSNIVCTYGGQEALQLTFKLFEGEKGAGFSPCWSCILENQAPYANIDFRLVPLEKDFSIDFNKLEKIVKEVSFFYLNSPHNPTGKVFSEKEINSIAKLCYDNEVFLVSDEAYEKILFDDKKHFSAASLDMENIISVFTYSKSYAMTGWRLGYLVSRHSRIPELLTLADYSQTAGVTTFTQYAGAEALLNKVEEKKATSIMVKDFQHRRDVLYDGLCSIKDVEVEKPNGAFYVFPSFTNFIPSTVQGEERKNYIFNALMAEGVVTVPGYCFGTGFDDHVRISFSTTPIPIIIDGIERIKKMVSKL